MFKQLILLDVSEMHFGILRHRLWVGMEKSKVLVRKRGKYSWSSSVLFLTDLQGYKVEIQLRSFHTDKAEK